MTDVLIVGAGPAGLSAAIVCAENGLKVTVLDEFIQPGGRLLGQLHQEPDGEWWNGIQEAANMRNKAVALGVDIHLGVSVYDVNQTKQGWKVFAAAGTFETPFLLLATGAAEAALPIPGWTLPGVMSIGAAQVMTNVHRVKAGNRGIVVGVNILSAAIMQELYLAGIDIAAMMLPGKSIATKDGADPLQVISSMARVAHLSPSKLIRFGAQFAGSSLLQRAAIRFYPRNGLKMWGIPIHLRKAVVEILGTNQVEAVRIADVTPNGEIIPGTETEMPVDFVCLSGGLYPLAELAAVAGCTFKFVAELGGHIPVHNNKMETPLPGLFVAGNITGIESAKVAIAQGIVAGLSLSLNAGKDIILSRLEEAIKHVETVREQALIQFHPDIQAGRNRLEAEWRLPAT